MRTRTDGATDVDQHLEWLGSESATLHPLKKPQEISLFSFYLSELLDVKLHYCSHAAGPLNTLSKYLFFFRSYPFREAQSAMIVKLACQKYCKYRCSPAISCS